MQRRHPKNDNPSSSDDNVRSSSAGFTVIELMITLGIVGVLSTVAFPVYSKYKTKVRYSEATQNLAVLFRGEAAMWQQLEAPSGLSSEQKREKLICACPAEPSSGFLDIGLVLPTKEPQIPNCAGVTPSGFADNCKELGFAPSSPIYFSYHTNSYGQTFNGSTPVFANWAIEDLDGDLRYGFLVELVHERDGELYRSGRYSAGDVQDAGSATPITLLAATMNGLPRGR